MLWFYWRRVRVAVLATGVALGALATLVVVAGSVSPAANRTAPRKTLASRISGAQVRRARPSYAEAASVSRGLRLMSAAVAACRNIGYSGVQMVAWWGSDDSTAYLIGVWHKAGHVE